MQLVSLLVIHQVPPHLTSHDPLSHSIDLVQWLDLLSWSSERPRRGKIPCKGVRSICPGRKAPRDAQKGAKGNEFKELHRVCLAVLLKGRFRFPMGSTTSVTYACPISGSSISACSLRHFSQTCAHALKKHHQLQCTDPASAKVCARNRRCCTFD